ncbi:hypothetical protein BDZ45DRAFT_801212 [Acephala macrosclerotiorum]|nr:hypothetical protein BDZ45DRAFT_801212 [Acephala macrosclerotiorum]
MSIQQKLSKLSALYEVSVRDALPEAEVSRVLQFHPFIPIPGALNLRTISSPTLKPGLIFRSGSLSHLSPAVLAPLKTTYGITAIFDLRSRLEREKSPSPEIPGIETVWIPSTADFGPKLLSEDEEEGEERPNTYKAVFERLRDGDARILFHCTAGKDRTGVLSALILALLDTPSETIAQDYALTRIGVEPFRMYLLKVLLQQMGKENFDDALEDPEWKHCAG